MKMNKEKDERQEDITENMKLDTPKEKEEQGSNTKKEVSPEEKKYKKKNRILILLLLLLLLCVGGYIYYDNIGKAGLPRQKNTEKGFLPGMSEAEIQAEMDKKVAESELAISINSKLDFPSGNEAGYLRIENSVNNHYLVMVEMFLKDTNEMVYQSGAIEPGYYLEKDKLLVNLEKGTYPVIVKFKAYHVISEEFIGEAQANSEIAVAK